MGEPERRERFRRRLLEWAEDNLRSYPWRAEEASPYEVFVAEVLLQRTFADKVEPVFLEFVNRYPEPSTLADVSEEELADLLEPLGLHNRRARALSRIGQLMVESGGVPADVDELLEWPRVGPYAANATACFGHGRRRPIVDANVARIYARVFDLDADGTRDDGMWAFAEEMLPEEDFEKYNLALLDFGALICTAQSPVCEECPMRQFCGYYAVERGEVC